MFKPQATMFGHATHFMIDMETIGVERKPPIVQIAITKYSPSSMLNGLALAGHIDRKFSLNSQIPMGRWPEKGATEFWMKQDPKTIFEVFNDPGMTFIQGMRDIHEWLLAAIGETQNKFIWAMGALNDLDWLHAMYEDWKALDERHVDNQIIYPFRYNQELCFRTEIIGLSQWFYKKHPNNSKHNALEDAKVQGGILIDMINNYDQVVEELAKL